MQVIPVIDLKAGVVVHAVAGARAEYQPLETAFGVSPMPMAIAELCVRRWHARRIYVADLDAIDGAPVDWSAIEGVAESGARLLIDVGIGTSERAREVVQWAAKHQCVDGIVVALESSHSADEWSGLVQLLTTPMAVFSLDLHHGRSLNSSPQLRLLTPPDIARAAYARGFRRAIALDLAAVGTAQGPVTAELCTMLRSDNEWAEVISGGAVRQASDVRHLQEAGCHAVLVASALYCGALDEELRVKSI